MAALLLPVAAWAATATVTASPSQGLADGQTITVAGAGYPANSDVEVIECHRVYGCDANTSQFAPAGAGAFRTSYSSVRIIKPNGKTIDCATTSNCVLVAVNFPNTSAIAETPIRFDPKTPILPPFALTLSLDGTDGVVVASGVTVLHGNLSCTRTTDVYIDADVSQSQSGTISESYGNTDLSCVAAHTIPWQLSVNPGSHFFATGPAQASVDAQGFNGRTFAHASANGTVILTSANLPLLIPSAARVPVPAPGATVVLHYWILLSTPSQFPVTFSYSTLNGTASAPADYVSTSGFVTMPAGSTKAIVPITINGTSESPGNRTFIVSLTNPSNAALGSDHGRGVVTLAHS